MRDLFLAVYNDKFMEREIKVIQILESNHIIPSAFIHKKSLILKN